MAYKPRSSTDTGTEGQWGETAFARIVSGPHAGRCVSVVSFTETGCRVRDAEVKWQVGDSCHIVLEDTGPMVVHVRSREGAMTGFSFRHALTWVVIDHLREVMKQPLQQRMARLTGGRAS